MTNLTQTEEKEEYATTEEGHSTEEEEKKNISHCRRGSYKNSRCEIDVVKDANNWKYIKNDKKPKMLEQSIYQCIQ